MQMQFYVTLLPQELDLSPLKAVLVFGSAHCSSQLAATGLRALAQIGEWLRYPHPTYVGEVNRHRVGVSVMDLTSGLDSLISLLDRIHARRFVVCIDPELIPALSAVCSYSTLKEHGVQALVPLTAHSSKVQHQSDAVVYISRTEPEPILLVSESAKLHRDAALTAIFVPEIPPSVTPMLTKYGVLGDIELMAWPLGFVNDVTQPFLLNLFAEGTATQPSAGVWPSVWALDALQASHIGAVGKITAVGPKARLVASHLKDLRTENAVKLQQEEDSFQYRFGYSSGTFFGARIEHMVVIDRDVDLVTPLLSQTTYEGVLDEVVGVTASGTISGGGVKASLHEDPLFESIAQKGFASACNLIHDSAKQLQMQYKQGEMPSQESSLAEIKSAISKIGSLQMTQKLVDLHTEIASTVMATLGTSTRRELYDLQVQIMDNRISNTQAIARIQDLIFKMVPIEAVLRPLCLLCIVRGGIKETVLQSLLYGDILRTYGYNHLPAMRYLKNRGYLFSPKGSSFLLSSAPFASLGSMTLGVGSGSGSGSGGGSGNGNGSTSPEARVAASESLGGSPLNVPLSQIYSWYTLNKAFKLYPHNVEPDDEAEPYAGYIPLTARIAQMALKTDSLSKTPLEPEVSVETFYSKDAVSAREAKLRRTLAHNSESGSKPIVLIMVVGGVTYAEAVAIRRAALHDAQRDVDVVVATTSIITGDKIVLKT